jgi:solute carrier family 35 protein E1
MAGEKKEAPFGMGVLAMYFAFWYIGNIAYNDFNKGAAASADSDKTKFAMIIATAQLVVGAVYALFKWGVGMAPKPKTTSEDYIAAMPAGVCSAGAHAASVFSLAAGGVAFGQIVKSAEPAFTAVISTVVYGKKFSGRYWASMIPIIGGVVLASLKLKSMDIPNPYSIDNIQMDFSVGGLVGALVANIFAGFKGNESHKLKERDGFKDRVGGGGDTITTMSNQFAVMSIISLLASIPLAVFKESAVMGEFMSKLTAGGTVPTFISDLTGVPPTTPFVSEVAFYTFVSGLAFYLYNEMSNLTMTHPAVDAATNSIANTAKRVIVIGWGVYAHGNDFGLLKQIGCAVCIGGVYLNSVIKQMDADAAAAAKSKAK